MEEEYSLKLASCLPSNEFMFSDEEEDLEEEEMEEEDFEEEDEDSE